ncbi:MerR family transcriptional regulator [Raoultibacter phocaeensis]|uniref:MerR family transcriptional regulator n=1 Tax=Raoultibacter phocaeensis TaxID=2479841 RepID=UPI001118D3E2|nr:MerR family transcriptional regulator [Raoultibacter phocaeensis]
MENSLLLSSGEFAQMCNVSRELLIHYDKIGLLKPKEVRENGYRYYSLKQLYLFDVIRFFLDTGMSMKEIKEYLDNRSTELFLENAQNCIYEMEKQRDIIDARISMMEKMRYITQRALLFPKGKARLAYWDEIWFITTEVERERTQKAYAEAMSEHSDFCRSAAGVSKFPLGRIVDIPDTDKPDEYFYTKLVTWIAPPENRRRFGERLEKKARGNYAVILHQGGTSTIARSYEKLFHFIKKEGFEMLSPLYELDMNSYIMSDSSEDYLIHISVLVDA